ncbi:MAG TPA: pilus assembly protein PilP [Thermodesulfovibrionales bacterium]|nr:pilus assembly protein PilP [Thermodesulfovibrionales bacterium]
MMKAAHTSRLRLKEFLLLSVTVTLTVALTVACEKEKPKGIQKQAQKVQPAEPPKKGEAASQKPEEKKVEAEAYSYSPQGRRDPFLSIIEASKKEQESEKKKRSLRPSEMYDVTEIRVIAIAKDKNRSYAMVQLPDKKYFTVKEGMTLGLNNGKVISIDAGSVMVREYIKNYKGEIQSKDTTLRLRKEEGE